MVLDNGNPFLARGTLTRNAIAVDAIIQGSCPTVEFNPVRCTASVEDTDWPQGFWQGHEWQSAFDGIEVNGRTADGSDIWIPDWRVAHVNYTVNHDENTWSSRTVEGSADLFAIGGLGNFSTQPERVDCVITLSPTPLGNLFEVLLSNWDGTVTRVTSKSEEEERKGIRWQTELGDAELIDNYEWHSQKIDLPEATLRVRRSQIVLSIQPTAIISLKDLFSQLDSLLDQPLMLVSFLSRRRIEWLKATATALGPIPTDPTSGRMLMSAHALHAPVFSFDSLRFTGYQSSRLPINVNNLREGLFQELLSTYQASPLQDMLRQTMSYEVSSREEAYYFEALLGLIYAGLEGLVNRLGDELGLNELLKGNAFKRLAREARKVIESCVPDKEIADLICGKVAELQRRSFKDALIRLLQHYGLDTLRVIPGGQGLLDVVPGLINRRNTYTHQGKLDHEHHGDDFSILQALLELWVLKLLACPESAIDRLAYLDVLKLPD